MAHGPRGAANGGLEVEDAQFISHGTAGRLPGLVTGQIDGVALHPEDVFLATQKKRGLHALVDLVEVLPHFVFNAYGASSDWIARDRALLRDAAAAMIEANRVIYRDKRQGGADHGRGDEVEGGGRARLGGRHQELRLGDQRGFDRKRTEWTIDYDVSVGDIEAGAEADLRAGGEPEARRGGGGAAGGRVTIGKCTE